MNPSLIASAYNTENLSDFEYESYPTEVSIKKRKGEVYMTVQLQWAIKHRLNYPCIVWMNEWFRVMSLRCSREMSAPRRNTPWLRRSWSRAGGQWTRCWPAPGSPTAPVTTARPSSPRATRRGSSTCCSPCPWCSSGSSTSPGQSRRRKGTLNFVFFFFNHAVMATQIIPTWICKVVKYVSSWYRSPAQ